MGEDPYVFENYRHPSGPIMPAPRKWTRWDWTYLALVSFAAGFGGGSLFALVWWTFS